MSLGAPQVYIADQLMNDHALSKTPMLAGLSFTWGTDSQTELDDPATCSGQLLIREPSYLGFLVKGAPFGLLDPGSGETLFAGRISTLKAKRDKRKKNALLISFTAADTQADIAGYRIEAASWIDRSADGYLQTPSDRRRDQLRSVLPAGWKIEGSTANDWHAARPQLLEAEPFLPILDRHVRTVIGRRSFTSTYVPGRGLQPRITITDERAKLSPVERLAARANGEWYRNPTTPTAVSAFVQLDAGAVSAEETEWEKTPDDTITDVALVSWGSRLGGTPLVNEITSSSDVWVSSYLHGDLTPARLQQLQAAYGYQQLQLDTDLAAGSPLTKNPMIENIVSYWINTDTKWRPTSLVIPDARKLPDAQALRLLSATQRYQAYLTLSRMQENTPAGGSRVRGYVLGGTATWTGKKWQIELNLGRVPDPSALAGGITFITIKNRAEPAINAGTAETIGTELTFADFEYIGA